MGPTEWLLVDQQRIDLFAEATGDHQWIHVDPERAAKGPFGRTIAHGFLTLSLTNMQLPELFLSGNLDWGVNYGLDKARFPAPVPEGSRLRATAVLTDAREIGDNAVQAHLTITVEAEGQSKPCCVAEVIHRYGFLSA